MSNIEYKPAEKLQLRLARQNSSVSWGFRLQGGIDFSTPLSIQSVNPNSVSEQCGLKAGDAILAINTATSDAMTHDDAKAEIMRSGNEIYMLVERGAVKIWKPQVTPLNELRPQELRTIKSATGEDINPVQKTSLAINKPPDEPCTIGSSHNRSAQPFGAPKAAVPNVVHSQYNSPMGMYSANNIADTYSQQTQGIQSQMANLDLDINKPDQSDQVAEGVALTGSETDAGVAPPTSITTTTSTFAASSATPHSTSISAPSYQSAGDEEDSEPSAPILQSRTFHRLQEQLEEEENNNAGNQANNSPGFRSVSAPIAKPPSERPKQPSMTCGGCGMLATGVIVKANGVPYHVACFKCTSCSMNLKQKGFFVVNDKLYCEIHAKSHSKPPGPDMVAVPVYR